MTAFVHRIATEAEIPALDSQIIADRTCFLVEADPALAACATSPAD